MRFYTLLTAVGLGLAGVSSAAPPPASSPAAQVAALPISTMLTAALDAYNIGRFADARVKFRALADADSAIAETMLGTMYARGQGVRADPATASIYYFRAAQRGYAPAQLALARAFATGGGVAVDRDEASIWARRARQRGDPRVAAAAANFIAGLDANRTTGERASLDARVTAWRPWPDGRE